MPRKPKAPAQRREQVYSRQSIGEREMERSKKARELSKNVVNFVIKEHPRLLRAQKTEAHNRSTNQPRDRKDKFGNSNVV